MSRYKEVVERIRQRYPFSHALPVKLVDPVRVEQEFGPHGSYVQIRGHKRIRVYCFASEEVRDRFKEKYPCGW